MVLVFLSKIVSGKFIYERVITGNEVKISLNINLKVNFLRQ